MANNRMQIYCTKCFGMACIAKYYPALGGSSGATGCWYMPDPASWGGQLNQFFEKHDRECWEGRTDMWGTGRYAMRTEMDDDKMLTNYDTAQVVRGS